MEVNWRRIAGAVLLVCFIADSVFALETSHIVSAFKIMAGIAAVAIWITTMPDYNA